MLKARNIWRSLVPKMFLRRDRPIVTSEFSLGMLRHVSGIEGSDFLRWMKRLGYQIFLLGRNDARRREVTDIDELMADWGRADRIEDMAFIPLTSWDPLASSALPFDIPLTELQVANGGSAAPTANGLSLVTATPQWAYSLMRSLLWAPRSVSGPVVVKAQLRVTDGAIGVLVSAAGDISDSIREIIVKPSEETQVIDIEIPEASKGGNAHFSECFTQRCEPGHYSGDQGLPRCLTDRFYFEDSHTSILMGIIPAVSAEAGLWRMGWGMPVIAAPVGGLSEQLREHEPGHIAQSVSAAAIADAMQPSLQDAQLRARLLRGVVQARAEFSTARFFQLITTHQPR